MGRKLRDTLLLLLVTAGCVLLTVATAGGDFLNPTTIYNFAFLGIIFILYFLALIIGFFRMSDLTDYFRRAVRQLEEAKGKPGVEISDKVHAIDTFRPLSRKYDTFLTDLSHSSSGICDIEDYINESEADRLIHKRMLDMIPDILTSLGILGTFMGLVWGLRSFQPSNYEAMTSSVTSLVDGIKVAFLTSIYGLVHSLVFSYSMRTGYQSLSDRLGIFLDRFHMDVLPSAEMEAQNLMVRGQKEQNRLLQNLVSDFSDQVAHGFAASMAPTLDRINTQLGGMMSTISQNQQIFLEEIVREFLAEMRKTFQKEFEGLGKNINDVNDVVSRNIVFSEKMFQNMSEELHSTFTKDETAMHTAVAELSAIQKKYADSVSAQTAQFGQILSEYQKAQEASLKTLSVSEQESARFWVACNQTMQNYLQEAAAAYDRFEKSGESSEKMLTAITAIYQKNEALLESYEKRMKEFSESQKKMQATLQEIERLFYQMEVAGSDGKSIFLYPGMSRQSKESEQRMVKQMETVVLESEGRQGETLEEIRHELKELADASTKKSRWFGR